MLMSLADDGEVIIAINANHIEGNKHRSDIGIALFRGRFAPHGRLPRDGPAQAVSLRISPASPHAEAYQRRLRP